MFESVGLAVGLGLLVGLQRERVDARLAGLRTFPMICVFGVLCAALGQAFGGWVLGAGFIALAALVVIGNVMAAQREEHHPGITTEVAILVMFAVGALLLEGPREVAVVVGAGLAVLLHAKPVLLRITGRFSEADVRAIMQFALVSLVVLPILPDATFGPYEVLNLRQIWMMVVLVVGVSLAGYVAQRLLGAQRGIPAAGFFGGLISSTATTIGFSRRTAAEPGLELLALTVIVLAHAVLHGRVLVEIAVAGPSVLPAMATPIAIAGGVAIMAALATWLWARRSPPPETENRNPAQLGSALWFAGLYAAVLLVLAAARDHFGTGSLYLVAALSGFTDMDAITLSTTRLADSGDIPADVAWRTVLIAAMANSVFKLGAVWVMGSRRLGVLASILFGIYVAAAGALVLLWPQA